MFKLLKKKDKTPTESAKQRIMIDLKEIQKEPPMNCSAGPRDDDIFRWKGVIFGPEASPYEGGVFELSITFPYDYPTKPPDVVFITKVYHPNIDEHGNICVDILKKEWSPSYYISSVLLSICSLLTDPNPKDPLRHDVAHQYMHNPAQYEITARQWTYEHAIKTRIYRYVSRNINTS